MEPFTSSFLTKLLSSLTVNVIQSLSKKMRDSIKGSEKKQALRRCIETGVVAVVSAASAEVTDEERQQHLSEILSEFFANPQVGMEIRWLLSGKPLDNGRLFELFEDTGFDADTLDINFDMVITSFQAGFIFAAQEEPTLQGIIQTNQLMAQIHMQGEILAAIRELTKFMRHALSETLAIKGGQITGQSIDNQQQIVFQLPSVRVEEPAMKWESHYLRTLLSRCDELDLSPIDRAYTAECKPGEPPPVKVSDVFTTLYLKGLTRFPDQDAAAVIQGKDKSRERFSRDSEEKQIPVQAIEAVGALPCLVILGKPGGGKSTLVNHMASHLARQLLGELSEPLPGWSPEVPLFPVHIVLRRFASWVNPTCRSEAGLVWDYIKERLKEWGCGESFEVLKSKVTIEEGGAIFFDGLDEVSETDEAAKRSLIIKAIQSFAKPLMDKCHIVITCREYAYRREDAWHLPESEFPVVELDLFKDEQIEHFTKNWYKVLGPIKGWTPARCEKEALNLYQAVTGWSHLRELAEYPLLLTLMAQVHGRDGYLPDDRADLYERTVELLLAQWENRIILDVDGSRKVEPGLVMRLNIKTRTLKEALERVAFAAHEQQETVQSTESADIPRENLREELHKELKDWNKVEEVIKYIQERAGLLHERANRTYAFPHRTFQEYLAAEYCLLQSDFDDLLAKRIKRAPFWWREVYLLAAGASKNKPRYITNMVDALVPFGIENRPIESVVADHVLIAAQALIETDFALLAKKEEDELGRFSVTYQKIHKMIKKLMTSDSILPPSKRAMCGVSLARLGDDRTEVMTVDGMEFCFVPAGPFWMGEGGSLHLNESLNYDYWASRYPVTNAQYREFVEAEGYKEAEYWKEAIKENFWIDGKVKFWQDDKQREEPYNYGIPFTLPNHPVVEVSWYEALAFTRWLTEKWQKEGKLPKGWSIVLPSEAEWEKAARGGVEIVENPIKVKPDKLGSTVKVSLKPNPFPKRKYPWGDEPSENLTNCKESGISSTSAVGCFPGGASPYGCEEKAGNFWEWTRSLYDFEYPYKPDDGRENLEADSFEGRTMRGGSWWSDLPSVGCGVRNWIDPNLRHDLRGFCCFSSPNSGLCKL